MRTSFLSSFVLVLVVLLAGCGRTEPEVPEDVPRVDAWDADAQDAPADAPCRTNADCDDRVFCNGTELCIEGRCRSGTPVQCDDGVACTLDRCDEATRVCVHTPDDAQCEPPARCDLVMGCTATGCRDDAECDDGNVCNGTERCRAGTCVRTNPPICDDGIPCTLDRCEPSRGCVNIPDDSLCDDGVFCNGTEVCNPMIGRCVPSLIIRCDDGNPCTVDRCEERTRGCVHIPSGDNDGDGFPSIRCGGSDCDDTNPEVHPGAGEICRNGRDDNCNGQTDCADPSCSLDPVCRCTPTGTEDNPRACRDGRDNDCDGQIDCEDTSCVPFCPCRPTGTEDNPDACRDGRDNDCDGQIDCSDRDCQFVPTCMTCVPTGPETSPTACIDGRDNDCDGFTDCADTDCLASPSCIPVGDRCDRAVRIGLPGSASGTTVGATDDYTPPCGTPGAPDVVYVFTNPVRQTITIDTNGSSYDTMLFVRRGDCLTGPVVGCDDDGGEGTSSQIVLTDAEPGTYYIFVDGFAGASGAYLLHVRVGGPREDCTNGVDDDGDGLVDCRDTADCGSDPACMACVPSGRENTDVTCSDGRDNDCDGFTDCIDLDCLRTRVCMGCVPSGPENNPMACSDGRDNDCDGHIDCADSDCSGVVACPCAPTGSENTWLACTDVRDNDCDGHIDCDDTDCRWLPVCRTCTPTGPENTVLACSDGRDNDCDGQVDCRDSDCSGIGACPCIPTGPEVCNDGRDNDCDRLTDCMDPDCRTSPFCPVECIPTSPETNDLVCADGRDNDCDRLIDCADPECATTTPCRPCVPSGPENTSAACSDGRDNDCDRLIDCADSDCARTPACTTVTPENTDATCSDGRDNDGDGRVDCADSDCADTTPCRTCLPTGPENTDATCSDGRDNDCDSAIDCADPGCARTRPCVTTPPNDTCAGAIRVGVPSTTSGTTVGAMADYVPTTMGFPGCAGGSGPDVVYTFTVSTLTPLTIDLVGVGWDPVLYVRRDDCTRGTQVACNDDYVGLNSRVAFYAAPGTYYVFVDGFSAGSQGAFTLTISVGLPAEVCNNGRDDDADTLVDCADPDCASDPRCVPCTPTGPENTSVACTDGRDNDCDRLIDCADPDCSSVPACCRPTGPENTSVACTDGRDNDCDRLMDCADPDCSSVPACCRPTGPENTSVACTDGRDNDCDRLMDCADPDCSTVPACCRPSPEICTDGVDNDCDGLIDCRDPNCSTNPACTMCTPTGTENNPVACTDMRDNDCDGRIDCTDPDCRPFMGPEGECCNGRDDNGNTLIDEFACACRSNADCVGIGAGGSFPSTTCYLSTLSLCGPPCNRIGGDFFCNRLLPGSHCDVMSGECR